MPRTVAYLRVYTIDQNLEKNKADILHLANDKNLRKVEFVEKKTLGKVSWKQRKIAHTSFPTPSKSYSFD